MWKVTNMISLEKGVGEQPGRETLGSAAGRQPPSFSSTWLSPQPHGAPGGCGWLGGPLFCEVPSKAIGSRSWACM